MNLNLRIKVQGIFILSVVVSFQKCFGNPASGKLDFGDSSTEMSLQINDQQTSANNIRHTALIDNISVPSQNSQITSCTSTGCNVTHSGNDTVETILVLKVETKVKTNRKDDRINKEFDIKDVPVSIGYNSRRLDPTFDDINQPDGFQNRGDFDVKDLKHDTRFQPAPFDRDPYLRPTDIARPPYSFTSRPNYVESRSEFNPYNRYDSSSRNHGNFPTAPAFTTRPGYLSFYRPNNINNNNFYPRENHPPENYGYNGNPYGLLKNIMTNLFDPYHKNANSEVNINVKSLTPLAVTVTDKNGSNKFHENGVELRIPHFEPSANRHYFGDESPPHSVLSKKTSNYNPVAYNPVAFRTTYQPSKSFNAFLDKYRPIGNNNTPYVDRRNIYNDNSVPRNHRHVGPKCPCYNYNHNGGISYSDPGEHISGKLAPLN